MEHDELTDAFFAHVEVFCAAWIGRRAALWNGNNPGSGGARNSAVPKTRQFAASVHIFLPCRNCNYLLVRRHRSRTGCALTLLLGLDRPVCSGKDPRLYVGAIPRFLRDLWCSRRLVQCLTPPSRTIAYRGPRSSGSACGGANTRTCAIQRRIAGHPRETAA